MTIKSLLLSSGAALAIVSGAHAADAIVGAEPEPLEYVRICDENGKGYFFIPGTETCLKVGGRVRTEGGWYNAYVAGQTAGARGTYWHTRAELSVDTSTDTEYGPLKTNTVYRWDWQEGGATTTKLLWANITLGGFLIGKADSQFATYTGGAGDVINDDVIDFSLATTELNQITYKYDAHNGFTAVISLEDSNSGAGATGANGENSSNHYAPDIVGGLGYTADTFGFRVVGGYDSIVEEGAIKGRLDAKFDNVQAFLMGGWNTDGDKLNKYAAANGAGLGWGDWAVWSGVGVALNDKLKWNLQLAYDDLKTFEATTNIKWSPVKDLLVQPEITYVNYDVLNKDTWAGMLRFQRTF
ncbi:porin [Rhizobium miluonense]|uniref:Porin n=1 Tax=Rhizobium miluonense TaxID=411945 RepID=A0A1C3WED4_9HYPH|nr:porin [Rhizobium miluonense]SCB38064.1 Porin subfamily protein [Rhizobium miluonense]